MSINYILGFGCGILIGVIFVMFLLKWMRKDGGKKLILDERQQLARGEGFKYGFVALAVLNALFAAYSAVNSDHGANTTIIISIMVIISITVYATYCILHDAYIGLNENPKRVATIFVLIGLFNLAVVVVQILHGNTLIGNGRVASWIVNLLCAIMMFWISGIFAFHQHHQQIEED